MRRLTPESAALLRSRWEGKVAPAPPDDDDEDAEEFPEGRATYRRHRQLERNAQVVKQKKNAVWQATGMLACEVCGFDFAEQYGEVGEGYIECHHILPLSEAGVTKTRAQDLALVCSNCHRMLHRRRPWLGAETLRELLARPS